MELLNWHVYAVYALITSLILLGVGYAAASRPKKIPGRFQLAIEMTVDSLRGIFLGALGEGGERHLPLVFALFFYILFANLLGLVPFFKSATSNPSTTIALGIIVFFYVQYVGIKAKGLLNYLKHFLGPVIFLAPLFIVIEILGEFAKPFSLGMRLFGNIYGEDFMSDLAAKGGSQLLHIPGTHIPIPIPFQIPVYALQLFTGSIQAFIFALLTCAYIGIMTENHHDEGDAHDPHPHHETPDERLKESLSSLGGRA